MPITVKQARTELRRRQAAAELQRRRNLPQVAGKSTVGDVGRLPEQDRRVSETIGAPSTIMGEPVTPAEKAVDEADVQRNKQDEWFREQLRTGRIKPVKSFWGKIQEEIPQMVGETAGAGAGAKVGARFGPWGAFIGAIVGAGVGAMGGKGYQQLWRMEGRDEPMTIGQIYKEQGWAGLGSNLEQEE